MVISPQNVAKDNLLRSHTLEPRSNTPGVTSVSSSGAIALSDCLLEGEAVMKEMIVARRESYLPRVLVRVDQSAFVSAGIGMPVGHRHQKLWRREARKPRHVLRSGMRPAQVDEEPR